MATALGKKLTAFVPRLISPLRRAIGLTEWIFARPPEEGPVGQPVCLGLIHKISGIGNLGSELVGDLPPPSLGGGFITLGKGLARLRGDNLLRF